MGQRNLDWINAEYIMPHSKPMIVLIVVFGIMQRWAKASRCIYNPTLYSKADETTCFSQFTAYMGSIRVEHLWRAPMNGSQAVHKWRLKDPALSM
jgi:hypothetical protein